MRVADRRRACTLLATFAAGTLGACNCSAGEREVVAATMTAVVEKDSMPAVSIKLGGSLDVSAPYYQPQPGAAPLMEFFTLTPSQTGAATSTVSSYEGPETLFLTVQLPGPRKAGEVVTVTEVVPETTGWSWDVSFPGPEARVGATLAPTGGAPAVSFLATQASGTIEVLAVAPMRLRMDVVLHDASGATMRVRGDLNFELQRSDVPCT